jgi:dTMP kinase
MSREGLFIVLEGTDGSGKTTQLKKLLKRLKEKKIKYQVFDFPQYKKPSSYFVKQYLLGKYGNLKEVSPYQASLFYSLDRFEASFKIRKALKEGKVVLANRYFASNLGHQGAKIKNQKERKEFFKWIYNLEFKILNLPKPDLNIFLHVPAEIGYQLILKKKKRDYLKNKKRDIHEKDLNYLKKTEKTYLEAIKFFPKDFKVIECISKKELLGVKEISEKIWQIIVKYFKKYEKS